MRYNLGVLGILSGAYLLSINKGKKFLLSKLFLWKGLKLTQEYRESGILWAPASHPTPLRL